MCSGGFTWLVVKGLRKRCSDATLLLGPDLLARGASFEQSGHDREEESSRPAAHQDAGESFDSTDQPPFLRQYEIAVACGCVCHGAEVQGRWQVTHRVLPHE